MPTYALVVYLFMLMGPTEFSSGFTNKAECEAALATIRGKVAEANASENPNKIVAYAAECVAVKPAPQGKGA